MIVVMEHGASKVQVQTVIERLNSFGFDVHRSSGVNQTVLGAIGLKPEFDLRHIEVLEGVAGVYRVTEPYKFASRTWKKENTTIDVGGITIGDREVIVMAGPSAVETREQMEQSASCVAENGATFLTGGAFKSRTSPYSFQGLGVEGLQIIRDAGIQSGLKIITEVTTTEQIGLVYDYVDVFLVGSQNMQNFQLLKEIGKTDKPAFLKRGLAATIDEWLMSAEYIMSSGNSDVILCERGIRTFESYTRYTLDLSAVPVVKKKSHLPVFVDPSQGTGIRGKVIPMARAAVAAGADGLMIAVHPDPSSAASEGPQSLFFDQFTELMQQIRLIASAINRYVRS